MTSLFTILAQTKSGTVVEIIILLLVAGLIAYLTAFFYYKSRLGERVTGVGRVERPESIDVPIDVFGHKPDEYDMGMKADSILSIPQIGLVQPVTRHAEVDDLQVRLTQA